MTPENHSKSAKYWHKHLASWEASAYFKDTQRKANWWDRLSTVFRGDAMYVRMQTALELLRPHLRGKTILDVGCASGRFAFQMLAAGAERVAGVDISETAISAAQRDAADLGLTDRTDFRVADLVRPASPLPAADLVTGLGVIEYFDAAAMDAFLGNLSCTFMLLDFPDLGRKREFPTWILRQIYIRVNRLPGVFLYSLDDFARLAEPHGFKNLRVIKRNNFFYVTNLPE